MLGRSNRNRGNLEREMTLLIQNHSSFLTHLTEVYKELASIRRDLDQIKAILLRHERILNELPEALRQKIGFTEGIRGQ